MRNIILCEGPTDGVLLQYFMRKVYRWEDSEQPKNLFKGRTDWVRRLKKGESVLDIVAVKVLRNCCPARNIFWILISCILKKKHIIGWLLSLTGMKTIRKKLL